MAKTLTFDLEPMKQTDNKVVFAEKLDTSNPLATRRVSGLYIDKRDLAAFGWTGDTLKLQITAA